MNATTLERPLHHAAKGGIEKDISLLRRLLLFSAVALTLAGLCAPAAEAATRIMLVGDSITQGSAGDYTWRYRIWRHLQATAPGATDLVGERTTLYDNEANRQGSTAYADPAFDRDHEATWGRPLAWEADSIAAEVLAQRPTVVCVLMGINDLAFFKQAPDEVIASMRRFVAQARAAAPRVRLVLGHVLSRYDFWGKQYVDVDSTRAFNAKLDALAAELSTAASPVRVARTDAGWDARTQTWDGTHPSPLGEMRIAGGFANALAGLGIGLPYGTPPASVPWPARATTFRAASTAAVPGAVPRAVNAWAQDRAADLRWAAAPHATGYRIHQRNVSQGGGDTELAIPVAGTSFSPGLLTGDELWDFAVKPVNDDGRNRLTWSAVPGATGYLIDRADVTAHGAWETLPYPVSATTCHDAVWHPDHTYEYAIHPVKGVMAGAQSAHARARVERQGPLSPRSGAILIKYLAGGRRTVVDFAVRWGKPANDSAWNGRYGYLRDDCTHFTSETMLAAGVPEVGQPRIPKLALPGDFTDPHKWWRVDEGSRIASSSFPQYPQRNASFAFTLAQQLRDNLVARAGLRLAERVSDPRHLDYGDLIFFDYDPDGHFEHAMIVTGFDSAGQPLYAQHSDSKAQASLVDARHRYPHAALEFWRIKQYHW